MDNLTSTLEKSAVRFVPISELDATWPRVQPFLAAALETADGELDVHQLRELCEQGSAILFVASDGSTDTGACVVEFIVYPNYSVMQVIAMGGLPGFFSHPHLFDQLKNFAKRAGVASIQALCRAPQERLFSRIGFESTYTLMRIPV